MRVRPRSPEARTRWVSLPFGANRRASGPVSPVYGVAPELMSVPAPAGRRAPLRRLLGDR